MEAAKTTGLVNRLIAEKSKPQAGNSVVRDRVVSGQMAMGLTDTDDAYGAVNDGAPVEVVYLDQGEGEMGTLINPNTVALIAGAPHTAIGKQFVDWLLRPETGLCNPEIKKVYEDNKGNIWIATRSGIMVIPAGKLQ